MGIGCKVETGKLGVAPESIAVSSHEVVHRDTTFIAITVRTLCNRENLLQCCLIWQVLQGDTIHPFKTSWLCRALFTSCKNRYNLLQIFHPLVKNRWKNSFNKHNLFDVYFVKFKVCLGVEVKRGRKEHLTSWSVSTC